MRGASGGGRHPSPGPAPPPSGETVPRGSPSVARAGGQVRGAAGGGEGGSAAAPGGGGACPASVRRGNTSPSSSLSPAPCRPSSAPEGPSLGCESTAPQDAGRAQTSFSDGLARLPALSPSVGCGGAFSQQSRGRRDDLCFESSSLKARALRAGAGRGDASPVGRWARAQPAQDCIPASAAV